MNRKTEGPAGRSIPNPIPEAFSFPEIDLFHSGNEHVTGDQNSAEHKLYSRWQWSGQLLNVEAKYGNRKGVFCGKEASVSLIQTGQLTLKKFN